MDGFHSGESESEDGDVVLLSEVLGRSGNVFGRLPGDSAGVVEAEELAAGGLGLDDAIGEEGEPVAGIDGEGDFCVFHAGSDTKGQTGFELDFFAVAVRREIWVIAGQGQARGEIESDPGFQRARGSNVAGPRRIG